MNTVTVILSPLDAEQFKLFQKRYELFRLLEANKEVYDIQFGKIIINVAFGDVQTIVGEKVVYKR